MHDVPAVSAARRVAQDGHVWRPRPVQADEGRRRDAQTRLGRNKPARNYVQIVVDDQQLGLFAIH